MDLMLSVLSEARKKTGPWPRASWSRARPGVSVATTTPGDARVRCVCVVVGGWNWKRGGYTTESVRTLRSLSRWVASAVHGRLVPARRGQASQAKPLRSEPVELRVGGSQTDDLKSTRVWAPFTFTYRKWGPSMSLGSLGSSSCCWACLLGTFDVLRVSIELGVSSDQL